MAAAAALYVEVVAAAVAVDGSSIQEVAVRHDEEASSGAEHSVPRSAVQCSAQCAVHGVSIAMCARTS